jgi:1,4-alpha-glucan branching enzyme
LKNKTPIHVLNQVEFARNTYREFGAHAKRVNGIAGIKFMLWAPKATRISVVGDFNHWDERCHPMQLHENFGIWELFVPGVKEGEKYKFHLHCSDGSVRFKSDPYATFFESSPYNASIICNVENYKWADGDWMQKRKQKDWKKEPLLIYEVHLGSWKHRNTALNYRELAIELVSYVKQMGFTHVEFLPVCEYPYDDSWGYQVTGFFAPTERFGAPCDFQYLVDTFHQNGIGVILDWVPGHFPMDEFSLSKFDGTCLYEYEDPRQGVHQDWGTLIFNYGSEPVRCFLIASAFSWLERYHIDGLRVDAIASMLYLDYSRKQGEWIPNKYGGNENLEAIDFLRQVNGLIHRYHPDVMTIAEESTAFCGITKPVEQGGLGFDFKWNMGWMHDILEYFKKEGSTRKYHHNLLTFGRTYQYSENFIHVFSHDEVVHGKSSMIHKMAGNSMSEKAQTLRALYTLMWGWPGKKTLFMGNEFGQSSEWQFHSSLQWHLLEYIDHRGVKKIIRDLNLWYQQHPQLSHFDHVEEGFEWINSNDSEKAVISFLRKGEKPKQTFLVIGNYGEKSHAHYCVGVPYEGDWKELINSNWFAYGGKDLCNGNRRQTQGVECDHHPYSLNLYLAANCTLIFQYTGKEKTV